MQCLRLLTLLLALQSAPVIAVLHNNEVMLAVQVGNVIYTAEFSRYALKPDSFVDGDRVETEIKRGKMKVKRKDGKIIVGRVICEQRILAHPIA